MNAVNIGSKRLQAVDANVKTAMEDFTSPELLYEELITQRAEVSSFYRSFHD